MRIILSYHEHKHCKAKVKNPVGMVINLLKAAQSLSKNNQLAKTPELTEGANYTI